MRWYNLQNGKSQFVPTGSTGAARGTIPPGGCVLPTVTGTTPATPTTTWAFGFWRAIHVSFSEDMFKDVSWFPNMARLLSWPSFTWAKKKENRTVSSLANIALFFYGHNIRGLLKLQILVRNVLLDLLRLNKSKSKSIDKIYGSCIIIRLIPIVFFFMEGESNV